MKIDQRISAVVGLSGAGKTTLIRTASEIVDFVHLSASDLIKAQIKRDEGSELGSEILRLGSIPDNQTRFVEAFKAQASGVGKHIVLDCHTMIDTPSGLERVPTGTFRAVMVSEFIFLYVDPAEIFKRRSQDVDRIRPCRRIDELGDQQELALQATYEISNALEIPITVLGEEAETELISVLRRSAM